MKNYLRWNNSLGLLALAGVLCGFSGSPGHAASTTLLSTSTAGSQGNGANYMPSMSMDGRYVTWWSLATGLFPGDTNNSYDVPVKDTQTGELKVGSTATNGTVANNGSDPPQISANGRYVVFTSYASNLVPGDLNNRGDVFVKDLQTGALTMASTRADGVKGNNASDDGVISGDGRYVAFITFATNLYPNDTNQGNDVIVKDMLTGETWNANVFANGNPSTIGASDPKISRDGRTLVFTSTANLVPADNNGAVDLYAYDIPSRTIKAVNAASDGRIGNRESAHPSISADGRYVAFVTSSGNLVPEITGNFTNVYVKDLQTGALRAASITPNGASANDYTGGPRISADGSGVAFSSQATSLIGGVGGMKYHLFFKNLVTGELKGYAPPVPAGYEYTQVSSLDVSGTGRYVAFTVTPTAEEETDCYYDDPSMCETEEVYGISQVYVWDSQTEAVELISATPGGNPGDSSSQEALISDDGKYVAFTSFAHDLVSGGDTNFHYDIFLRNRDLAPADAEGPEITLTAPADGATYVLNQPVAASYTCTDSGSGLASSNGCVGTVADGANIDTASLGVKSFTVNALDGANNPNTKTVNYTVVAGTNNAEFVSQAVPSYMVPGQSYTVAVTMKNTGTSYWTPGQRFYLSVQNPINNTNWGPSLVSLPVGGSIAPGDTHTFRFWVKAPAAPGSYNFQWRMAQYGVEWFGQTSPNLVIGVGTNSAEFVSQVAPPSTMSPGQRAIVSVTVRNTGATTWTYGTGFVLSAQNPTGNRTWGTCLRYLPAGVSVAPGQTHTFTFVATAPSTPGTYHFQWRMAQTGVTWFGETSPDVAVAVQ